MSQFDSASEEFRHRRWTRHDAHRWMRPDAKRWLRPGFEAQRMPAPIDRKYSPDQPRVPAGSPDGGQWTSGGAQSAQTEQGSLPDRNETAVRGKEVDQAVQRDETGEQTWESIANEYRADGSLERRYIFNRDGSAIRSEFPDPKDRAGWGERHTVVLPDGSITTFENSGSKQIVSNGEGQILSSSVLTAEGVQPEAIVQTARAPGRALDMLAQGGRAAYAKGLEAAATLFTWLSSRNSPDETAALFFRAEAFQSPGGDAFPFHVGQLSETDTETQCPKMGIVQNRTDEAARETDRANYRSDAEYGTAVHTALRDKIRALDDSNLVAERSLLKSKAEVGRIYNEEFQDVTYGTKGSLRVDVLENTGRGTVCVYDIKTGKSGLSGPRIMEIMRAVYLRFPQTKQIVILETRPR